MKWHDSLMAQASNGGLFFSWLCTDMRVVADQRRYSALGSKSHAHGTGPPSVCSKLLLGSLANVRRMVTCMYQ